MAKYREPCGCLHDGRQWLFECGKHKAENDALHERAMRDHRGESTDEEDWLAI
jgi:hypothetical protein